ncbi:flavodoxin family protein [Hwangdonia seohaensis]|uniref:Flavodoxin family protein n=1 Tax=Hwangdonia seohaensis TaxID=1240727 RepID=A0ABW3RDP0_9FLAO|nr:NAD(P)H-dependent oxidoreductase [Hwangdonia seohaensis]
MNKTVIIQGSARPKGDTERIVNYLALEYHFDVIDLHAKNIGHYDYDYKNADDDFIALITNIIANYDTIIFATPVYWYTMSGHMKVFFDRISDLIRIHKPLGRQLRGKNMAMISTSNSNDLIEGFNGPFVASANYLGMNYLGDLHTWVEDGNIPNEVKSNINGFVENKLAV